jgi:tetrapyrrole methylase family protein/MazG family protein
MGIVIIGLGPGNPAHLTREADQILRQADAVYLRTGRHPILPYVQTCCGKVYTFDHVYEEKDTLPEVYEAISGEQMRMARERAGADVYFAVPGHPLVGEVTTQLLLERAPAEGIEVRIVEGLSFIEPTLTALGLEFLQGVQVVDALDLITQPYPRIDPERGVIVGQVYSREVASDVKLTLGELYPDEHEIALVRAAGTAEQEVRHIPLYELDRQPAIDHLTTVYVPPLPYGCSWEGLQTIVARLRAPDGCPWDRKQTHRTLRTHLLDEAYEVLDALDRDDTDDLCVELGDLALQIALHIQIAREEGEFKPTEVFAGIISKLRRRHPHVFGDVKVRDAEEVMVNWEQIKRQERGAEDHRRLFEGVPASLPALSQALTYQERAARVGYEPADGGRLNQLFQQWLAVADGDEELLGELLFALVDSARRRGINPENALRVANARFAERFQETQAQRHRDTE